MTVSISLLLPIFEDEYDGYKMRTLVNELERLHQELVRSAGETQTYDAGSDIEWIDNDGARQPVISLAGDGGDSDIASVVLLAAVENTDGEGDQAFVVDVGGHTLTATEASGGIAEVRGAEAKFGSFSLFADDGAGAKLARWGTTVNSTDFDFGSGDFTLECHLLFERLSSTTIAIFAKWIFNHFSFQWTFQSTSKRFALTHSINGTSTAGGTTIAWPASVTINTGQWYHMAASRDGNTIRFFVDGVLCATEQDVTGVTYFTGTTEFEVFSTDSNGAGDHATYIDNMRVTKGVARYKVAFTPPTKAFSALGTDCLEVGNAAFDFCALGSNFNMDADELRIRGITTPANYVSLAHDDTDLNIVGVNTTDINITGITALSMGTVDLDADAITATSYGGILEANLVSKIAVESITGAWTWDDAALAIAGATAANKMTMVHDDTKFDFTFANTNEVKFTGTTSSYVFDRTVAITPTVTGQGFHVFDSINATLAYDVFQLKMTGAGVAQYRVHGMPSVRIDTDLDVTGALTLAWTPQTALTTGLASTDELLVGDANVTKRMDISVIEAYMQANLTFTTEVNDLTAAVTWANVPDANITQGSVTQHEAALTILESQITDANLLARLADVETITGEWTHSDTLFLTSPGIFAPAVRVISTVPAQSIVETDAALDEKAWDTVAVAGQLRFRTTKDDYTGGVTWMAVNRTAAAVDSIAFSVPITATSHGGILEANLLDKTAAETITGVYDHSVVPVKMSGSTIFPGAASGNAFAYHSDALGLVLYGEGSVNDVFIAQKDGTFVMKVPTGTQDAQFGGAITATSYGGILEADLVSKSAAETIAAVWDFTTNPKIDAAGIDTGIFAEARVATHTGDVTGPTALVIDPTAISGKTLVTAVATDMVLLWDATDSAIKRADISDLLGGGGGITWEQVTAADTIEAGQGFAVKNTSADFTITIEATIAANDEYIIHNASDSTKVVDVEPNTGHTIKGPGGDVVGGTDTLVLAVGETVHLVAVSTSILEIV